MTDLPEWNDLPEATRTALCDEGVFWEHANGGDAAHAIYRKVRELLAHRTNGGEAGWRCEHCDCWSYEVRCVNCKSVSTLPVSIPQDGTSGGRVYTDDQIWAALYTFDPAPPAQLRDCFANGEDPLRVVRAILAALEPSP